MQQLVSLRALVRHLRRRFGDADAAQLRRDAQAGIIPSVRLGAALAFDIGAVEAALLARARDAAKAHDGGAT